MVDDNAVNLLLLIGTKEDRVLASSIAVLLCVQFGAGSESEDVFRSMKPHLITVIQDQTAGSVARASVRKTIICFDKNVMVNWCIYQAYLVNTPERCHSVSDTGS